VTQQTVAWLTAPVCEVVHIQSCKLHSTEHRWEIAAPKICELRVRTLASLVPGIVTAGVRAKAGRRPTLQPVILMIDNINIFDCLPARRGHGLWPLISCDRIFRDFGMRRCFQCGGKFGLVRHAFFRAQFCSVKCLHAYKQDLQRRRTWFRRGQADRDITPKTLENATFAE
jgi:hypothetical protein